MYNIVNDNGEIVATNVPGQAVDRILNPDSQPGRVQTAEEKQIEVFLERNNKPEDITELFWMIDQTCALIKVTSEAQASVLRMKVENLVRVFLLEHKKKLSLLDLEGLEFYTDLALCRSIKYDGQPNERDQWTMVQSRQRVEQVGGEPGRVENAVKYLQNMVGKGKGGYYG